MSTPSFPRSPKVFFGAPAAVDTAPPLPPLPPFSPATQPEVTASPRAPSPKVSPTLLVGAGEGGEGGEAGDVPDYSHVTNADFLAAAFPQLPQGAFPTVCSKQGNPELGGWVAARADLEIGKLPQSNNNYISCSSYYPCDDGSMRAIKFRFAGCHFLMLDDLGTKVLLELLGGFRLSALIETSPGNYQGIIFLTTPITDGNVATRLLNALINKGLCDAGASGPLTRWARLPDAINGKPKHANEKGAPFCCRLAEWNPNTRYTLEQIVDSLQLELPPAGRPPKPVRATTENVRGTVGDQGDDVWIQKEAVNPVLVALQAKGLYKTPQGSGKHDMTCPWVNDHTDAVDSGSVYFEPDDQHQLGGFCCQHSHREQYHIRQLLEYLGIEASAARHKSVIRVVAGQMHRVVDAAECEIANYGQHYQYGGLIVSIATDPTTGDTTIVTTSLSALTQMLSVVVRFESYNAKLDGWVPSDPPTRHVGILYNMQEYRHLPPLAGVVRQPYFRESDGELILDAGYDADSHRFGVFDSTEFPIPEPTPENARIALAMLEELIAEFHFGTAVDRSTALCGMFTAVVRTTLDYAPAYNVKAHVFGSGKSYLCDLIGAFAGPGGNNKVSYPTTPEEATKVILALLLTGPAVIDFDDMVTDWIPHGIINRALTSDKITDRILGVSKTATVSTRTLFLGSGNNTGPVRDLLRRVATIHLDPHCATPATLSYTGNPVEKVRKNRGKYVAAVLTIILAYRNAGSPRSVTQSIVTYGGAWTQYCREPLMWLGHPDPATSLIEQVTHDPDADALSGLLLEWYKEFGSTPTTVRKVVTCAEQGHPDLRDAIHEFPVVERNGINPSKFGWFLKKNANRIVGGFSIQQATADGRVAWSVVPVGGTNVSVTPPPLPPLPVPAGTAAWELGATGGVPADPAF